MGQLAGRPQQPERRLAGTSQTLFMEPCADCGAPVTLVGGNKPDVMRCARCAAAASESDTD